MEKDFNADALLIALQGAVLALVTTHPEREKLAAALTVEREAAASTMLATSPSDEATDTCLGLFDGLLHALSRTRE